MLYGNHHTVVDPSVLFLCGLKNALEANSLNVPTVTINISYGISIHMEVVSS